MFGAILQVAAPEWGVATNCDSSGGAAAGSSRERAGTAVGNVRRPRLRSVAGIAAATVLASAVGVVGGVGAGVVTGAPAFADSPAYTAQCTTIPFLNQLNLPTTVTAGKITPPTVSTGTSLSLATLVLKTHVDKTDADLLSGHQFGVTITAGATVTGATPASGTMTFSKVVTVPTKATIPSSGLDLTAPGIFAPATLTATSGTVTISQDASTATGPTAKITVTLGGTSVGPYDCSTPEEAIATTSSSGLLHITTASLPDGTLGSPYATTLTASGGTPPYRWSATGLPNGLSVSSTGQITGTPKALGTFTVKLSVTEPHRSLPPRPRS